MLAADRGLRGRFGGLVGLVAQLRLHHLGGHVALFAGFFLAGALAQRLLVRLLPRLGDFGMLAADRGLGGQFGGLVGLVAQLRLHHLGRHVALFAGVLVASALGQRLLVRLLPCFGDLGMLAAGRGLGGQFGGLAGLVAQLRLHHLGRHVALCAGILVASALGQRLLVRLLPSLGNVVMLVLAGLGQLGGSGCCFLGRGSRFRRLAVTTTRFGLQLRQQLGLLGGDDVLERRRAVSCPVARVFVLVAGHRRLSCLCRHPYRPPRRRGADPAEA